MTLRPFWAPILLYHRVVPATPPRDPYRNCVSSATFAAHMAWLARRGYRTIQLADLRAAFEHGAAGRVPPRRSVVITFDDGYEDTYAHAWPILRRHGFSAAVFVVADAIGGDNRFDAAHGEARAPMLTAEQLRTLHRQGVEIGSHTCSHPDALTDLADGALWDELTRSRSILESALGAPVRHFAYPHSRVDGRVEAAVERAGYELACAGVGTRFDPFCLQRVEPPPGGGPSLGRQIHWRHLKWLLRRYLH